MRSFFWDLEDLLPKKDPPIDEGRALVALMRAAEAQSYEVRYIPFRGRHGVWLVPMPEGRRKRRCFTKPTLLDAVLAALADLGVAL